MRKWSAILLTLAAVLWAIGNADACGHRGGGKRGGASGGGCAAAGSASGGCGQAALGVTPDGRTYAFAVAVDRDEVACYSVAGVQVGNFRAGVYRAYLGNGQWGEAVAVGDQATGTTVAAK